jgi:hypothetical protein
LKSLSYEAAIGPLQEQQISAEHVSSLGLTRRAWVGVMMLEDDPLRNTPLSGLTVVWQSIYRGRTGTVFFLRIILKRPVARLCIGLVAIPVWAGATPNSHAKLRQIGEYGSVELFMN